MAMSGRDISVRSSAHQEELWIQLASECKDDLTTLARCYGVIADVIRREHDLVRNADLVRLQALVPEKEEAATQVEALTLTIVSRAQTLMRALKDAGDASLTSDGMDAAEPSLSHLPDVVERLATYCHQTGVAAQVLRHLARSLRPAVERLLSEHNRLRPAVETNQFLVARMLREQQESFRFWQEVQAMAGAPYDAQGQRINRSGASILKVGA